MIGATFAVALVLMIETILLIGAILVVALVLITETIFKTGTILLRGKLWIQVVS